MTAFDVVFRGYLYIINCLARAYSSGRGSGKSAGVQRASQRNLAAYYNR